MKCLILVQQVLLAWSLNMGIGVLPKSMNPCHIAHNIRSVDLKLNDQHLTAISSLNKDKSYVNLEVNEKLRRTKKLTSC